MNPILASFPLWGTTVSLPGYGAMVSLGFAVGVVVAVRAAKQAGVDVGVILDLAFAMLVAGVVGARGLFVALSFGDFANVCTGSTWGQNMARPWLTVVRDCTAALRIWEGGLVFYGGAIAATVVAWVMARNRHLAMGIIADLFAPGLALGHGIGRVGCFLAGCCYGKTCAPTGVAARLGLRFPPESVAHADLVRHGLLAPSEPLTPALAPTQLYEAAGDLGIFLGLSWLARRKPGRGTVALAYACAYAALRFGVEIFRGDPARRFVFEFATPALSRALGLPAAEPLFLSTSQAVSVIVAGGAGVLLWRRRGQAEADRL